MIPRRQVKNPHAEAEQFRRRAALGFLGVLVCLLGLGGWYFKLQVLDHDVYATRSEANRIKPRPVVPGRGMIYDRSAVLVPRARLAPRARDTSSTQNYTYQSYAHQTAIA